MKIVVAPDSFKGSISARELCHAIRRGIQSVHADAIVEEIPLADGGEGTVENMVYATNGSVHTIQATGPNGQPVEAIYGVLGDNKTVVIEIAQASGLTLLKEDEKNPLTATSFGTGELIRKALDQGYRQFIIGLGGSATNDGGTGMLSALGVEFYDQSGGLLPAGGAALADLAYFDESHLDPRLSESTFIIASDVTNVLCGPDGASAVFGPQKGASPEMVKVLDHALHHFAEIVIKQKGIEVRNIPGSGAAGGTGAAFIGFLNATIKPGIEVVMEAVNFGRLLNGADLLITGEGKLDTQTLSGKVIAGVAQVAGKHNVPVVALCGSMELSGEQMDQLGVAAAFSLVPGPCSLPAAMENASSWTQDRTEQLLRLINICGTRPT